MCTLDVMGYSAEQMFTVPFLVLMKAEKKVKESPTEINIRIRDMVKDTCKEIISAKTFREDLLGKMIEFAFQKPN